jgi:hypothetical protein
MNRRIAKKIIGNPLDYSNRAVRTAARKFGHDWWCGDYLDFWAGLSELPEPRARRLWRRVHIRARGSHNRWHIEADVPF